MGMIITILICVYKVDLITTSTLVSLDKFWAMAHYSFVMLTVVYWTEEST